MQLYRARSEIEAAGLRLVLIGQATPRQAAHFRRKVDIDLPVLADERRESYDAAGTKIATMSELIGPKVVAGGALVSRRYGVMQGRTVGHPAQLGGAMIVAPDARVAWSHMASDAGDNVSPEELVDAARRHL